MMSQQQQSFNLPPNVANWQPGQPVPQGYRLGRKGFIKPIYTLPSNLSNWQQGQAIPEGYRLGRKGTLKPITRMYSQYVCCPVNFNTVVLPAVVEVRQKAPVVQEIVKPGLREEIQPVIHREREQLEIREEIQPIYEQNVRGTIVENRNLPAEVRPDVRLGTMPVLQQGPRGSVIVESEHREAFVKPALVEETIHKKIIEEVQPVIHREVIAPRVIRETQPIFEKVIEAPVVNYTTLPPRFVGNQFSAISSWQPGQPIPQGYYLGKRGFLKPVLTLPPHLQNWQQGQPIPQGYRVGRRGTLKPLNTMGMGYGGASPLGFGASPMMGQQGFSPMMGQQGFSPMMGQQGFGNLPPNVANWQQGQPIPQGWRLGRKGYLKPIWNAPPEIANWQQGQPIPQGYRLGKKGTLKPLNYGYGSDWNKFQQQQQASFIPTPVQKF